jgi:hypothetical protein
MLVDRWADQWGTLKVSLKAAVWVFVKVVHSADCLACYWVVWMGHLLVDRKVCSWVDRKAVEMAVN